MSLSFVISSSVATLLTPIVVSLWSRACPPPPLSNSESKESLQIRNGWIDNVATIFMLGGACIPLIAFGRQLNSVGIWAIGLMFGLMVATHFMWICLATIPFGGFERFREFWRFYELRWGIGMNGICIVYIPIAFLGLVSSWKIWL